MTGLGRSPKTNFGGEVQKTQFTQGAGSPGLDQLRSATGTIIDIRMPGEFRAREGAGILVRIHMDKTEYQTDVWIPLKEDYHYFVSNIGNREAVLKNPPRVMYHFNPVRFNDGYAELICDNKQERAYDTYARNNSGIFINAISGLARGVQVPG